MNNIFLLFYSSKPRSQVWNSIYRNWSIWDSMGFTPVSVECRRFPLFLFWEWNYMLNHSISPLWLSSLTSIEDLFESWMGRKCSRRLGICPKKMIWFWVSLWFASAKSCFGLEFHCRSSPVAVIYLNYNGCICLVFAILKYFIKDFL